MGWGVSKTILRKTANVASEINKIKELTIACFYEEIAIREVRYDTIKALKGSNSTSEEGSSKIKEKDIRNQNDTLLVTLPPVEVFDIIMNPTDFTTEFEDGKWSHELVRPIKEKAKKSGKRCY